MLADAKGQRGGRGVGAVRRVGVGVCDDGGEVRGFSGFHRSDVLSLRDHLSKRFDMELKEGKRAVRGGNWGDMRLDGE